MFNLLSVPYMNMRLSEMNLKKNKQVEVKDLNKKSQYIEYPEEILETKPSSQKILGDLLKDNEMREKFFEGVSYEKDPAPSSDE